jgi:hypothetical protein
MGTELLELFPGSSKLMKPLFKTEEAYQKFRREFHEEMAPALEEFARKYAESVRDSMRRPVNSPAQRLQRK